jgi:hypothetical protein
MTLSSSCSPTTVDAAAKPGAFLALLGSVVAVATVPEASSYGAPVMALTAFLFALFLNADRRVVFLTINSRASHEIEAVTWQLL